jgi:predicted permease
MRRETRINGIRRLFRLPPTRASVERDVSEEIRFHIESRTADLIARHVAPDAARAQAEREFGDPDAARHEITVVDQRRVGRRDRAARWESIWRDLMYSVRALRRQPAFTAVVVLTLALGIGANATMFGLVDRLLLRPPARLIAPDRTGRVYIARLRLDGTERIDRNINYLRYTEMRDAAQSFDAMAAFFNEEQVVGSGTDARHMIVSDVSASFWSMFDARAVAGQLFTAADDQTPSGAPVAVLGHEYWTSAFGAREDAVGTALQIGGRVYTIIGVAPPGFTGMSPSPVAAFIPITAAGADQVGSQYYQNYSFSWLEIIARRRPSVSIEAASAELGYLFRVSLERQYATSPNPPSIDRLKPRAVFGSIFADRGPLASPTAPVATWTFAVAFIVLLIACANVANLMLARAVSRRREVAVRIALGVRRGRLVGQLLMEVALLALLAGGAGLLLAQWVGGFAQAALMPDVEWGGTITDRRIVLFGVALALLAGSLIGILPAIQIGRPDVVEGLKESGRDGSASRSRVRWILLATQGALSVVLLLGAGLFVRSLHNVRSLDLGVDADHLVYARIDLRGTPLSRAEGRALRDRMLERAQQLPMVTSAAVTATVPFYQSLNEDIYTPGADSLNARGDFYLDAVSPSYFQTTSTAILHGRGIEPSDADGSALVVVVSRSMAERVWPGADPIGKCLRVGADTAPCRGVVGVVQDLRWGTFEDTGLMQYYVPLTQYSVGGGVYIRTRDDARQVTEAVRVELQRLMPGSAYVDARPLRDIIDPNMRSWRMGATMFTLFGALALFLVAVGLYSTIAYGVAQRIHEFGVRSALGATASRTLVMVLGEGVRVVVAGVAAGLILALAASSRMAAYLFRVSPHDAATIATVVVTLLTVSVIASLVPAWRATRVDPVTALRAE